ncbi:MAG: hypothetical protein RKO66_20260 [Candidatus Contendobacter sp.]|nr:hypothetical protein [Candidatus Contendobacter sp.]
MSIETVFVLGLMVLFIVLLFKFLGWLGRGSPSPSATHARPVEEAGEGPQTMAQDQRHHTDAALISSRDSSHSHDSYDPPPSM